VLGVLAWPLSFYLLTDQIGVEVFRNSDDDSVIVSVNLRREIWIDFKVVILINSKVYSNDNGLKGRINLEYTLSSSVQGIVAAKIIVGQMESEISEPQIIPGMYKALLSIKPGGRTPKYYCSGKISNCMLYSST